jgi:hypothetical protein
MERSVLRHISQLPFSALSPRSSSKSISLPFHWDRTGPADWGADAYKEKKKKKKKGTQLGETIKKT